MPSVSTQWLENTRCDRVQHTLRFRGLHKFTTDLNVQVILINFFATTTTTMKLSVLTIIGFFLPFSVATGLRGDSFVIDENHRETKDKKDESFGKENDYRKGCHHHHGLAKAIRPWSNSYSMEVSATCVKPWQGTPMYYVAGTSDTDCDEDEITNCEVEGNFVKCQVSIAPHGASEKRCNDWFVNAKAHIFCC